MCTHSSNRWPLVQPSIDFFCSTHMCVLAAAIGLAKLLNVQNLQLISASIYTATHKCVLTAAIGRPALGQGQKPLCWPKSSKGQHTCVCGQQQLVCQPLTLGCNRSSIRSAKVVECSKLSVHFFIDLVCYTHVCAHSSIWSASPRLG